MDQNAHEKTAKSRKKPQERDYIWPQHNEKSKREGRAMGQRQKAHLAYRRPQGQLLTSPAKRFSSRRQCEIFLPENCWIDNSNLVLRQLHSHGSLQQLSQYQKLALSLSLACTHDTGCSSVFGFLGDPKASACILTLKMNMKLHADDGVWSGGGEG